MGDVFYSTINNCHHSFDLTMIPRPHPRFRFLIANQRCDFKYSQRKSIDVNDLLIIRIYVARLWQERLLSYTDRAIAASLRVPCCGTICAPEIGNILFQYKYLFISRLLWVIAIHTRVFRDSAIDLLKSPLII